MDLSCCKIGILMESDFFEHEIWYYHFRFLEAGVTEENLHFMTRLWGNDAITFHGHEYKAPFYCNRSFEKITNEELAGYAAIIVPSGIVADRLRYFDPSRDSDRMPPAAAFLRRAFANRKIIKGIICHGLWLAAPVVEVVKGRRMTTHNNLIGDARAYGVEYVDQDLVVDGEDLVSARTGEHCHLLAGKIIEMILAHKQQKTEACR